MCNIDSIMLLANKYSVLQAVSAGGNYCSEEVDPFVKKLVSYTLL